MKHKVFLVSILFTCLVMMVFFQNCSQNSDSDKTLNKNSITAIPEVYVTTGAPCTGTLKNNDNVFYGETIFICIKNAGNNPNYCIKRQSLDFACGRLSGTPGWSYTQGSDQWSKAFPFNPDSSLYFIPDTYSIRVFHTSNSVSEAQASFTVVNSP